MSCLPWGPLLTVERSGLPEITLSGIISVCAKDGEPLLSAGESQQSIWSRSLIKPWQLVSLLPILKATYPKLESPHYAMMLASHNGEERQVQLLKEIGTIGRIQESYLRCPACLPLSPYQALLAKIQQLNASPWFHPCCGKHLGVLLALQAEGTDLKDYLNPDLSIYQNLKKLLGDKKAKTTKVSLDGCGMPNYALSPQEMARCFCDLAVTPSVVKTLMQQNALLVGGEGRLDSRLMAGDFPLVPGIKLIAKEGADGLLGVGVEPTKDYPNGLGICIKLASGYDSGHLETLLQIIFHRFGILQDLPTLSPLLTRIVHF